jgi:hypothetical protein
VRADDGRGRTGSGAWRALGVVVALAVLASTGCDGRDEPRPGAGVGGGAGDGRAGPAAGPDAAARDLVLTTDRATYAAGEDGELRLGNDLEMEIGYNLCFSSLERREELDGDEAWVEAREQVDDPCPAILQILHPGGIDTYPFHLPEELTPGEYRFVTPLEDMMTGFRHHFESETFTVTAPRGRAGTDPWPG